MAIGLPGMFVYLYQMSEGMGVAGITRPVFWGFYITNFVFWIGISHAGTLISAILRLVNATWRRPVREICPDHFDLGIERPTARETHCGNGERHNQPGGHTFGQHITFDQ